MRTIENRIDDLMRRDRLLAIGFTAAMWLALLFVFAASLPAVPSLGVAVALGASMVVLGGFNTASMLALIRRYRLAKDQVYRPDIENLDRQRAGAGRRS